MARTPELPLKDSKPQSSISSCLPPLPSPSTVCLRPNLQDGVILTSCWKVSWETDKMGKYKKNRGNLCLFPPILNLTFCLLVSILKNVSLVRGATVRNVGKNDEG